MILQRLENQIRKIYAYQIAKHGLLSTVHAVRMLPYRYATTKVPLTVLFLYADTKKYGGSLANLQEYLRQMHGCDIRLITIDNFRDDDVVRHVTDKHWDISGDNSQWEFSGWKKGIQFANSLGFSDGPVLFVNDAFLNRALSYRNISWFQRVFSPIAIRRLDHCILGQVFPQEGYRLRGQNVTHVIRTHFFATQMSIASQLTMTYVSDEELDRICPHEYDGTHMFMANEIVEVPLQHTLEHCLRKEWTGREALDDGRWGIVRQKIRALLNERLLSIDALSLGCTLKSVDKCSLDCQPQSDSLN